MRAVMGNSNADYRHTGTRKYWSKEVSDLGASVSSAGLGGQHYLRNRGNKELLEERINEPGFEICRVDSGNRGARVNGSRNSNFSRSLLSRWDAGHARGRPAQLGSLVSDTLTARERDVLVMISRGLSNKRIAQGLKISPETVKSHVKRIFFKLAVSTRAEAAFRAVSLGLL
jgi:DNA-binding CsgD family transcriptional regulator